MYAEDIFLLNAAMNYAILLLTRRITKSPARHWRIAAAACLGGIYAVLMFFPRFAWAFTLPGMLALSIMLIFTTFGKQPLREFGKTLAVFYFVTFAMAGAAYGITSLLGITGTEFPLHFLAITTLISYAAIMLITKNYRLKSRLQKHTAILEITHNHHKIAIPCLADTGNESSIAIAEFAQIKSILPPAFCESFENSETTDYIKTAELLDTWKSTLNLRIVPFNSLGKSSGMLLALKADKLEFAGETLEKTLVGLYKGTLTPTGIYQAIV